MRWITKSGRDLAVILGDFRNYVHPAKEHRYGVSLGEQDSQTLRGVAKNLVGQLITSTSQAV